MIQFRVVLIIGQNLRRLPDRHLDNERNNRADTGVKNLIVMEAIVKHFTKKPLTIMTLSELTIICLSGTRILINKKYCNSNVWFCPKMKVCPHSLSNERKSHHYYVVTGTGVNL